MTTDASNGSVIAKRVILDAENQVYFAALVSLYRHTRSPAREGKQNCTASKSWMVVCLGPVIAKRSRFLLHDT